jgi:hypothetical protein
LCRVYFKVDENSWIEHFAVMESGIGSSILVANAVILFIRGWNFLSSYQGGACGMMFENNH